MTEKVIDITLHISELLYDIANKTYLVGNAAESGENFKEVARLQVDEEMEKKNQVLRSIGTAYAVLKDKLARYLKDDTVSVSNALLAEDADLKLTLHMPMNFHTASAEAVCTAMHGFVVNKVIGEWFHENGSDGGDYLAMSEACLADMRVALNRKDKPLRIRQRPF